MSERRIYQTGRMVRGGTFLERFWRKVETGDGCWMWTGAPTAAGYGTIRTTARDRLYVHRVSWELAHTSEIPAGLQVCHSCDTPLCVNPAHLFLGTGTDNMKDCARKGRIVAVAKLNGARASEIARRASAGERCAALAEEFGVSGSTISKIRSGKAWRTSYSRGET